MERKSETLARKIQEDKRAEVIRIKRLQTKRERKSSRIPVFLARADVKEGRECLKVLLT